MKTLLIIICAIASVTTKAQTGNMELTADAPRFLRQGDHTEFTTKLINHYNQEITGQVQLELIDAITNQSVDGWFLNTFPNQYFTISANSSEEVKFPIQVPYDYRKDLKWRVTASVQGVMVKEENSLPVLSADTVQTRSASSLIELKKKLFVKGAHHSWIPVNTQTVLHKGDTVKVRLELSTGNALKQIQLKDGKAACFLPAGPSSLNNHGKADYNQNSADASLTYLFKDLPKGNHVFEYALTVSQTGKFSNGATSVQTMNGVLLKHLEGSTITVE